MPESLEEMLAQAKLATQPDFRGKLLSRGAARGLVWKNGQLPLGSPGFAATLSEDLGHYGFGMLSLGLRLREAGDQSDTTLRTFECASRALESIVINGPPEDGEREFYVVVSACAAHLGRFSARAASILNRVDQPNDESHRHDATTVIRHLILRRLDELRELCWKRTTGMEDWDRQAEQRIKNADLSHQEAAAEFIMILFFRGVALFGTALQTGDELSVRLAIRIIHQAERISAEIHHPVYWWCCRLVRHLFDDLWPLTLHQCLPLAPTGASESWREWRWKFITLLASRSSAEVELWPSQVDSAAKVCGGVNHLIAALPTSAGKTRIAEIAIFWALSLGQKVVFVTPLRALSAQTERSLARLFEPLGATVTSAYAGTGVSASEAARFTESNVVVSTPEKLDFGLRNNPSMLDSVGCVVLDEGHMLKNDERGIRYEVLIQRLVRRTDAPARRIVCLSAMLPDDEAAHDFGEWLSGGTSIHREINPWRPTRRVVGQVNWSEDHKRGDYTATSDGERTWLYGFVSSQTKIGPRGGKKHFPTSNMMFTVACTARILSEGRSVMIYCAQRNEVESIAKAFVSAINEGWIAPFPIKDRDLVEQKISLLFEWLDTTHPVFEALRNGLAVHHARLPRPVLSMIEELLAGRLISAVVASPTLAQGLNLSASCLLFHSTQRRFGPEAQDITPDEIANVAGRAGRAFVDVEGLVLGMGFSETQRDAWQRLHQHAVTGQAKLESGLLLVAVQLLRRILPNHKREDLRTWIAESSPLGLNPTEEDDEEAAAEAAAWDLLDTALLALAGETESDVASLAETLDNVLTNSFLRKRLARLKLEHVDMVNDLIVGRAQRIWGSTNAGQRLACYQSGVGVRSGLALAEIQTSTADLLAAAHDAVEGNDQTTFASAMVQLADLIWRVAPFSPQRANDHSSEILSGWLTGVSGSDLSKLDEEAMSFIEDAIIYRLTWGVEAVRMMAVAGGDTRFDENPSSTLIRLEYGLFSDSALFFRQSGFESRLTCDALPSWFTPPLKDIRAVDRWLESANAKLMMADTDFPSVQTHHLFVGYMERRRTTSDRLARLSIFTIRVSTSDASFKGPLVAKSVGGKRWSLYTADLLYAGEGHSEIEHFAGAVANGFGDGGEVITFSSWLNA
jgi:hypothetical protein